MERVDLGVRPTPVERRTIAGLEILVKRDDLTSVRYGGNKVRSLEYLLAGAPRRVLTFSSLSAHHAYATASHAAALGIPCDAIIVHLGVRGPVCERLPEVADRVAEVRGVLGALWATLRFWRPGTRIILPGGASPRGALGYVAAVEELEELEEIPRRIYVPLGTGTTVSGILAGLCLRGAQTEVVGVKVARPLGSPWRRARKALALLGKELTRGKVSLRVVEAGGAYGEATPEALAAVAAAGDLKLEPTYTGKTLAVMLAERAEGALFWNTYAGPLA